MNSAIRRRARCGVFVSTVANVLMAGVMLAAFALPANAGGSGSTKSISFSVSPAALTKTTTVVYATITNTGNSTANSFEIDWSTSSGFNVISASGPGCGTVYPTPPGLKGTGYSRVVFYRQLPVKASVTVALKVTVPGTKQCTAAPPINWFAYAWTGAPGQVSQSFALAPGPYTTTLPSSAICTATFSKQPQDAFIGSTITSSPFNSAGDPVSVTLTQNGNPVSGTTVSVGGPACSIAPVTATTDALGIATFDTLTSTAADTQTDCQLTAASDFAYSSPAASDPFNAVKSEGILDCGEPTNTAEGINGATASGTRLNNADGECGDEIPYTLIWRDDTDVLEFVKDDLGQAVAMTFTVTWPNEPAPTAPLPGDTVPTYGLLGAIKLSQQEFVVGEPKPIDLCVGTPVYDLGDPTVLESLTPPEDGFPDLGPEGGTTQYGCVYQRNITLPEEGTVGLKESIYLQGDWGAARAF